MKVVLIRHGEPNYNELGLEEIRKCTKNIASLSARGRAQAKKIADDERVKGAQLIISSPYCRAFQTAHIISVERNIPIIVEHNLHEWESDEDVCYGNSSVERGIINEFVENKGEHNAGCKYSWESLSSLSNRIDDVLKKYIDYKKIIIVSHAMIMRQLSYKKRIEFCEILEVEYSGEERFKYTGYVRE